MSHTVSREELVEQGIPVSEASRLAVQASIRAALEISFERCGPLWLCVLAALVLGMLYVTIWADRVCEAHRNDKCDQPLAFMLRLLSVILVVITFQQAIIRNVLCYSLSRDGPTPPCRVVFFRRASVLAAVLWPIAGYWMVSRARECSSELKTAVRVLTDYYIAVAVVALLVPALFILAMVFLLRHQLVRLPRSRHAAPEGLLERLPTIAYDPALFRDGGGRYPSECPICLEPFSADQSITRSPCQPSNHAFHTECLRSWLQCARTCPLCRADLAELGAGLVDSDSEEEDDEGGSSASGSDSDSASGVSSGGSPR